MTQRSAGVWRVEERKAIRLPSGEKTGFQPPLGPGPAGGKRSFPAVAATATIGTTESPESAAGTGEHNARKKIALTIDGILIIFLSNF
jgi:hypothetical protein